MQSATGTESAPQSAPPSPGGPIPGAYAPQQPSKKKHTVRNVLLVIVTIMVLAIGGCLALLAGGVNEVNKSITESQKKDNEPGGSNNPLTIHTGRPFEVSGFNYQGGWSVGTDALGDVAIKNLRVENNRGKKDSALVEIKLWRGKEVLALSDCTTEPIAPGTITRVSCMSADRLPKHYDRISINDTF